MVMKKEWRLTLLKTKNMEGGKADEYLEFIVKTLKPK
jgi:predicted alpha/beta superfamily hydrolase